MSIREQLALLVQLQGYELEISRLDAELVALPAAREQLQQRITAARGDVANAEASRETSEKDRRALEGELSAAEAKIDDYQTREMEVRTNEQLWALQEQTRTVRERAGRLEEQILEEMEQADACTSDIAEASERLQRVEQEVAGELRQVDADEARLQSERETARGQVDGLESQIDPDLHSRYERVKSVRGGVGLAELAGDNCSACNVRLRPQVMVEVVNMEAPTQCDNCKRILFSRDALELPSSEQVTSVD